MNEEKKAVMFARFPRLTVVVLGCALAVWSSDRGPEGPARADLASGAPAVSVALVVRTTASTGPLHGWVSDGGDGGSGGSFGGDSAQPGEDGQDGHDGRPGRDGRAGPAWLNGIVDWVRDRVHAVFG